MVENNVKTAVLYSDVKPDDKQTAQFIAFLKKETGAEIDFRWQRDESIKKGFRIEVDSKIYDWTVEGRFRQFLGSVRSLAKETVDIIPLLKENLSDWEPKTVAREVGTVTSLGDCVATVKGLKSAFFGEILIFGDGVKGMVQSISEEACGCILFDDSDSVSAGTKVRRSGKIAGFPCGAGFLGRVTNALGEPIDSKGGIDHDDYRPMENAAPGIIEREAVNKPLETGILAIDAIFPIGK